VKRIELERGRRYTWRRIVAYKGVGMAFIRLTNGPGIHIKDTRRHRLLASERFGMTRRLQIGPYSIKVFTK
jgi:hypothetical protein